MSALRNNTAALAGVALGLAGAVGYFALTAAPSALEQHRAAVADMRDVGVMARWNAVPLAPVAWGERHAVGVVAHTTDPGGVDRVEFYVDGALAGVVRERTRNPRTGAAEFWLDLDTGALSMPAGQAHAHRVVTLTAVVHAAAGAARSLSDELTAESLRAGTHALPIVVRRASPAAVYVSLTGSDNNPGTREAPLHSIGRAIRAVPDGGDVVLLDEGRYAPPQNRAGSTRRAHERWITVRPAPGAGLDAGRVIIGDPDAAANGQTLIASNASWVRWQGLTIDLAYARQVYNVAEDQRAWLDGVRLIDARGAAQENASPPVRGAWWATGCAARDVRYAFPGALLVSGCEAERVSGDVLQNARAVVDFRARQVDGSLTGHHTDVVQFFGPAENIVYQGITAEGLKATQGFFLEPTYQSAAGAPVHAMRGAAFVDITMVHERVWRWSANEGREVDWGGAPWSQMLSRFSHVLFESVKAPHQRFILRTDVTSNQAFAAQDVVFRGCLFHQTGAAFARGDDLPEGVTVEGCAAWTEGDLTYDGRVDFRDLNKALSEGAPFSVLNEVLSNFGRGE